MANKTLKQIADELGIDKQKVYRFVKANHINEVLQSASPKQYDETAQKLIKSHFSQKEVHHEAHHEVHQNHINDALYEALLKQLEEKDKQLAEKDKQLSQLQKLIDQEQQLHMATKQQLLALEQKEPEEAPKKKRWFW